MTGRLPERRSWLSRMAPRVVAEEHRVSTPLELLFDLTFVVAVSQVARELAQAVAAGHPGSAVPGYLMVFFAIWWAWMNFTWFASAYDTDDVPYRLLTLVQMAGVLVLAAGVPGAFEHSDFLAITIGYVIMRGAMVTQWARAAHGDLEHRATALRYVVGTAVVQLGWLLRLTLPHDTGTVSFVVLAAAELAVPVWAERASMTTWHPHHIAERYGLFTIIVLGESVLAATTAVQAAVSANGVGPALFVVAAAGLALLFALWWIYFLKPAGPGLARRRDLSFWWGYGHYGIFAGAAAIGTGLEVAAEAVSHHIEAYDASVVTAVALPTALFLALVFVLHAPLGATPRRDGVAFLVAVAALGLVVAVTAAGLPLEAGLAVLPLPPAALVALGVHQVGAARPI